MLQRNQTQSKTSFALTVFAVLILSSTASGQSDRKKTAMSDEGFAVVELFTSQGCSSCPSADDNLAAIAKQAEREGKKVITLSFHVDYWNSLGWEDPYSTADATKRQRLYAGVHGSKQVYTPQMVVNGTTELLGSSRDKSKAAIQTAIKKLHRSRIELTTGTHGDAVEVEWKIDGMLPGDLVNLALVQNQVEDEVNAGENGGRKLKHVNVVRDFRVVDSAKEQDSVSLTIPEGLEAQELHVVAFLQSPMDADIHAVARRDLAPAK